MASLVDAVNSSPTQIELQTFGSPAQLAQAGTEQITQVMLQAAPRMRSAHTLAEQITTALAVQTVTVPGTASAGEIISGLAEALAVPLKRRENLEIRVAALLEALPLPETSSGLVTQHAGTREGGRRVGRFDVWRGGRFRPDR